jgi:nicotinamidase-related amidase
MDAIVHDIVREVVQVRDALLLIDIQNEVLHPQGTLRGDLAQAADSLLANVRRLVSWARGRDFPVIWIRMAFRPGYIDASRATRATASAMAGRLVDGTWGAELVEGLGRTEEDIVVTKKRPSAFFNTDLEFVLRGLGVDRLIVAGTSTNWAVEATVRDAESRDYGVVVVREATGARMGELHESALHTIASRYGEVKSIDDLLATGCDAGEKAR